MKKSWQVFFILICLFFSTLTNATSINRLIVFGDSLSDNGNFLHLTSTAHRVIPRIPIIPKDPPYFQGRFSNGFVWVEDLAKNLHLENNLQDYAVAASWVEPIINSKELPTNLNVQVNYFLLTSEMHHQKINAHDLFIFWVGSNDYLVERRDPEYATTNTVSIIRKQIDKLISHGAKNFLILNVPDVSLTPEIRNEGPDAVLRASALCQLHNQKLAVMLEVEKNEHPTVNITPWDVTTFFADVVHHPEKYHLKESQKACYGGGYYWYYPNAVGDLEAAKRAHFSILENPVLREAYHAGMLVDLFCSNPDDYLFWDHIHPTRVVHQMIADYVTQVIQGM